MGGSPSVKLAIVVFAGILLPAAWIQADSPFAYGMTGETLLKLSAADRYADRALAAMYLTGIKDATQGSAWCAHGVFKPDELDSELIAALRRLPVVKLRDNAAPLVLDALRTRFPCIAKGRTS